MPTKTPEPESLRARLLRAQQAASPLEKHGHNPHHGYHYAATEDTVAAARSLLHEAGLVARRCDSTLTFLDGDNSGLLHVTFEIACPATGETEKDMLAWPVVVTKGRPADKAMAASLTTAWNYWLIGLLQLPRVDEEVDSRDDTTEPTTSAAAPKRTPDRLPAEVDSRVPLVPFGANKGQPINEISNKDLDWLAGALRKSVADPDKARWAADNQRLLDACIAEAESRQDAPPVTQTMNMAERLEAGFIMLAKARGIDKAELIAELGAKTHPDTGKLIRPKSLTAIHRSEDWQNYTWERLRGALMDAMSLDADALEVELTAEAVPF